MRQWAVRVKRPLQLYDGNLNPVAFGDSQSLSANVIGTEKYLLLVQGTDNARVNITFQEQVIRYLHNSTNGLDVNRDGRVSPSDALAVINLLNASRRQANNNLFLDVNNDGKVAPIDALWVINALNNPHATDQPEGEEVALAFDWTDYLQGRLTARRPVVALPSMAAALPTSGTRHLPATRHPDVCLPAKHTILDDLELDDEAWWLGTSRL